METPELEKIATNRDESQKLGEFLHWLRQEQELHLCTYDGECEGDYAKFVDGHGVYSETPLTPEKLLALYFEVDLDKAEKERRGLLDELRASQV